LAKENTEKETIEEGKGVSGRRSVASSPPLPSLRPP
jgi:hypothetical protein